MRALWALLIVLQVNITHAIDEDLVFGMSTALSGQAAPLGRNLHRGFLIAFDRVNRQGGIDGRRLRIEVLDDRYEPKLTSSNMQRLVENPEILAIIGNLGTPTAVVSLPIIASNRLLFYAPATGAGILRTTPPLPWVVNVRASYRQEVYAMIDALIRIGGLRPEEIGFFTQRDAYGDAGYYAGLEALTEHGLSNENDIVHVRYERNTLAVENALADILLSSTLPRAIINIGVYTPVAKLVRLAHSSGYQPLFLNISFTGHPRVETTEKTPGAIIVTQIVPHPLMSELPIVQEYRQDLQRFDPQLAPSFWSLEAYIAGRILIRALRSLDRPPDRDNILSALTSLGDFDAGLGYTLELTADKRQASDRVWPMLLRERQHQPFQWQQLKQLLSNHPASGYADP